MKPRRGQDSDTVAFAKTYREQHKRHGLSWANGLAGAALGVAVGADTVYTNKEKESSDSKEIEQTTT